MVRREIASRIVVVGGLVCANVSVNKGEDVVKDKVILLVALSNARSQSLETRARADPLSNHLGWNFLHQPSIRSQLRPIRSNPDGSWDSICLECFLTIATAEHEAELADREANHICKDLDTSPTSHAIQGSKL
jgi:hypothetical protein